MTTDISEQTDVTEAARKEAAWARMEQVVRQAAEHTEPADHSSARDGGRSRHRLLPAALVVGLLLLGAAALAVLGPHRTTAPPQGAASATGARDVTRLESATSAALAAIATERASLNALTGIPTPSTVAPATEVYGASLLRYARAVQGMSVPPGARPLAAAVVHDATTIAAQIHGLRQRPPILLGAFLTDLTARSTELEQALTQLDDALRSPRTP